MRHTTDKNIFTALKAHGLEESDPLGIRIARDIRRESLRSLREMEESFRRLESIGIIPRGYVRYMNDMIVTIQNRITHRL